MRQIIAVLVMAVLVSQATPFLLANGCHWYMFFVRCPPPPPPPPPPVVYPPPPPPPTTPQGWTNPLASCSCVGKNDGFTADPTDCTVRCLCSGQKATARKPCPSSQFVGTDGQCGSEPCPSGATTAGFSCADKEPNTKHPDPVDCASYYYCDANSVRDWFTCPPGGYYSSTARECEPPSKVTCSTTA